LDWIGVGAHLRFQALSRYTGSELQTQFSYVGGRPQLSHMLPLPSRLLGGYQIMLPDDRGTWLCEQHAWSRHLMVERRIVEPATTQSQVQRH